MIEGRTVLALLPARGGSKGLPGKNILPAGGRPLIAWSVAAARASRYIDRVVLSSDDPHIIAAAVDAGCEAPFVREAALATDVSSSVDVVVDAIERLPRHDIVVLLQPTSPLRNADDIDGALSLLVSSGAPSCVSICPAAEHPYWMFRRDSDGVLSRFASPSEEVPSRRQDLPPAWCLNGAVYATWTDHFLGSRSFLVETSVGYPMPVSRSLDIDTLEDFEQFKSTIERATPTSGAAVADQR